MYLGLKSFFLYTVFIFTLGLVAGAAFYSSDNGMQTSAIAENAQASVDPEAAMKTAAEDQKQEEEAEEARNTTPEAAPGEIQIETQPGDTILSLLQDNGVTLQDAYKISEALESMYNVRSLARGQKVTLRFKELAEGGRALDVLVMHDTSQEIRVLKNSAGDFYAQAVDKPTERQVVRAGSRIKSSLLHAANLQGVPNKVMQQFIYAYSWDIDFQREIHEDDRFEVLYEQTVDSQGNIIKVGNLLYGRLEVRDKPIEIFYYADRQGNGAFFMADGSGLKKALMKTPIDGARISSGFGMRTHPILGYSKMHRGVDFAAREGTPIYAAGDGVVAEYGRKGSYGNYLRLRHNGEYSTAYAHLSRYAKGIKSGTRVKQGQVVAYVGTTGRSTGPHLHYEVLYRGKQVNPVSVKIAGSSKLPRREMTRFMKQKARMMALRETMPLSTQVAWKAE